MSRHIDADELKFMHGMGDNCSECEKELKGKKIACEYDRNYSLMDFCEWIDDAPTIEPRKGKWINRSLNILYPEWERYTCSVCGKHSNNYDFCPNCGADMRKGEDEQDD